MVCVLEVSHYEWYTYGFFPDFQLTATKDMTFCIQLALITLESIASGVVGIATGFYLPEAYIVDQRALSCNNYVCKLITGHEDVCLLCCHLFTACGSVVQKFVYCGSMC